MLNTLSPRALVARTLTRRRRDALILALFGASACVHAQAPADPVVAAHHQVDRPALASAHASEGMLLGATRAGTRIVAVGDHGTVVLSDDDGKTFRQARQVPVRAMLNAVSFVDDKHGWAVGHRGVILATEDGGDTWKLQREDLDKDQPLFSVLFVDGQTGWACGLWSLLLHTRDGGKTWNPVDLPAPEGAKRADRNLYSLFADRKGSLFIAAEQGRVLHSADQGASWEYLDTGYKGSLWTGTVLSDGTLMVGGLRGAIYRSGDGGRHWMQVKVDTLSSITAFADGKAGLYAAALDGVVLRSTDHGSGFSVSQRPDRLPLTALVPGDGGHPVLFSKAGVLHDVK